jgi:hypothetical protein
MLRTLWRAAPLAAVLCLTLIAGTEAIPSVAATPAAGAECPTVVPIADLTPGMDLTGWTVREGTTPQAFQAEVLGVLEDGILPGRDLIVVRTSGSIFDGIGGVWAGMSGSPVYLGEDLVGAIAYGFSSATSPIAGVTPAEDMVALADDVASPARVKLDRPIRSAIARAIHETLAEIPSAMRTLRVPVGISGAGGAGLKAVRKGLGELGVRAVVHPVASAASDFIPGDVDPGDSISSVWSYGDFSMIASGTATYVCGDDVVAFGHSLFNFAPPGEMSFGMSPAPVLGVIVDDTWGSFKLTTSGPPLGTFVEDRFAGQHGYIGMAPGDIPILTHVTDLDNDISRDGGTDIIADRELYFMSGITLMLNVYSIGDRVSPGTLDLETVIEGIRSDGSPWTLERDNRYTSVWDIGDRSTWELSEIVDAIAMNKWEDVAITGIDLTASFTDDLYEYRIRKVEVTTATLDHEQVGEVTVAPGEEITLSVTLGGRMGQEVVDVVMRAPKKRGQGSILVTGGGNVARAKSHDFDALLAALAGKPRDDDIVARLSYGTKGRAKSTRTVRAPGTVLGERTIFLEVN